MDRADLIDQLPEALSVAIRLDESGHPPETIAQALGIPIQSVSVTLRVAALKLDQLAAHSHQAC